MVRVVLAVRTGLIQTDYLEPMNMKRSIVAALALAPFFASAVAQGAELASPEGVWELEFRDSRFAVSYCEGEALCGELVWLSEGASTPEKVKYLNTVVIDRAQPTGPYTWKGEMNLLGEMVAGSVKQVSDNELDLTGCKFLILCRTYKLYRYEEPAE